MAVSLEAAFVLIDKASGPLKEIRRQAKLTDQALRGTSTTSGGAAGWSRQFTTAGTAIGNYTKQVKEAGKETKKTAVEADNFARRVKTAWKELQNWGKTFGSVHPVLTKFAAGLGGAVGGLQGMAGAFKPVIWAALAAAPVIVGLAGAVGALVASLGAAVGGGALLGAGLLGSFAVGLGSVVAVAKPAITQLQNYEKATKALNTAMASGNKTQIAAKQKQLDALAKAHPGVAQLSQNLDAFKKSWDKATRPGQASFFKLAADGLGSLRKMLPTLAGEVNKNTSALERNFRKILAPFIEGRRFQGTIAGLGSVFRHNLPGMMTGVVNILKALGNILKEIAPTLDKTGGLFAKLTGNFEQWTRSKTGKSRIHEMTEAFKEWGRLLGQVARLIGAVMGQGIKPGTSEIGKWADKIGKLADSLRGGGKQKSIADFFQKGIDTANNLWPVLKNLATALMGIYNVWKPLGSVVQTVLKAFPPGVVGALSLAYVGLKGGIGAAKGFKGVASFFGKDRDGSSERKSLYVIVTNMFRGGGSGAGGSSWPGGGSKWEKDAMKAEERAAGKGGFFGRFFRGKGGVRGKLGGLIGFGETAAEDTRLVGGLGKVSGFGGRFLDRIKGHFGIGGAKLEEDVGKSFLSRIFRGGGVRGFGGLTGGLSGMAAMMALPVAEKFIPKALRDSPVGKIGGRLFGGFLQGGTAGLAITGANMLLPSSITQSGIGRTATRIGMGAATGATFGSMFGPLGTGIGALAGGGLAAAAPLLKHVPVLGAIAGFFGGGGGPSDAQKKSEAGMQSFQNRIKDLKGNLDKLSPKQLMALKDWAFKLASDPNLKKYKDWLVSTGDQLQDPSKGLRGALAKVQPAFQATASVAGQSLQAIQSVAKSTTAQIQATLPSGSAAATLALSQNYQQAAADVQTSMQNGVVANTAAGIAAVNGLMAKAFQQLGFTGPQSKNLAGMLAKGGSAGAAAQNVLNVAQAGKAQAATGQGGAAAGVSTSQFLSAATTSYAALPGKHAAGGRLPGPAMGDHIPLYGKGGGLLGIADGGELVVNKHTENRVNAKLAAFGTTLGREVSNETRPHSRAFYQGGRIPTFQTGGVTGEVDAFFSAAGFNKIAIAGILGNAMQESGLNPNTAGGGMWQQISNFGQGTGGSLQAQMVKMLSQIGGLRAALNSASSPGAAATIFEQGFEKAGIPALANRIKYANEAYSGQLGGTITGGTGGAAAGLAPISIPVIIAPQVGGAGATQALGQTNVNAYTGVANAIVQAAGAQINATRAATITGGGGGAGPSFVAAGGPTPPQVQYALQAANALADRHPPYGHQGAGWGLGAYDCSSYVSTVMDAAGIWPKWAYYTAAQPINQHTDPGPGQYITIGTWGTSGQQAHTMMSIMGNYFESGGGDGGPHRDSGWSQKFDQYRHPHGYATGGLLGKNRAGSRRNLFLNKNPGRGRPGYQPTQAEAAEIQRNQAAIKMQFAKEHGYGLGGYIPWFAGGGDFVARRPTVIGVGDRPGGERVTVSPTTGPGSLGGHPLHVEIHHIEVNREGDIQKIVDRELQLLAAGIENRL